MEEKVLTSDSTKAVTQEGGAKDAKGLKIDWFSNSPFAS